MVLTPAPLIEAGVRSLLYAEMTTSPTETCGAEPPSSGRFSRIQSTAALVDSFAPAASFAPQSTGSTDCGRSGLDPGTRLSEPRAVVPGVAVRVMAWTSG
jgi:hypothetical protein